MWHVDGGMGWWMLFGWLWFAFFWGAVIWAIVRLTQGSGRGRESDDGSALEILRRRYARGEIDKEHFDQMRRDLGG